MAPGLIHSEEHLKVWSLLGSGDTPRVEAMLGLYAELFPQYAHYLPRMRRRSEFGEEHRPGHFVHYWLVEVDGQPAAIRIFRYLLGRHLGLAHALAVGPAYRGVEVGGQRLSMFLVHACLDQIVRDAERLGNESVLGMVNEVESPQLMKHYRANGIMEVPVEYVEPVFPPELPGRTRTEEIPLIDFSPMFLGFLPNPRLGGQTFSSELITDFALAFLVDHYGLPLQHPRVQEVLASIPVLS
jgi:hypothetical protein